jgi:mRNA deadenylase 3'-5' endonuclease subunit Ccr4
MTVSHIFSNRTTVDCSVNYQAHERNLEKEKPDEKLKADYNVTDEGFLAVI